METKKISKWDAAPESIKNTYEYVNALYDPLPDERNPIIDALSKVLDDYNELEVKYQKQCGMISEYEEERQKDGELAKFIGNEIVECIKQGAENGCYEVHPLNRFDIHIEETKVTPMRDRHAIPRIAVQCNNVQTEMERDTAQHEREELEKKLKSAEGRCEVNYISYNQTADDLRKLQEFLKKGGVPVKYRNDATWYWDFENSAWGPTTIKKFADLESTIDSVTRELEEQRERYDAMLKSNNDLRKRILDLRRQLEDNGISNYWSSISETNILDFSKHDHNVCALMVDAGSVLKPIERTVGISEEMVYFISSDSYNNRVDRIITSIKRLEAQYDELKEENNNLKQTLLNILETLEAEVGLCRVHLLDSYEDRANLIAVEHNRLLIKYVKLKKENEELKKGNGLCSICGWKASGKRKDKIIERQQQDIDCLKSLAMDLSGKIIHDDREDAIPDDVTTMTMCGHYYWYKKPDGEKKEKLSGRYPWGNEKHKYKMFDCPYLKDKYYNF